MRKVTHNADKKNILTKNDLTKELLDYEFSRAIDKEIQTQVFSTNVPNNPIQPLEITEEPMELPNSEISDIMNYDNIPTINVSENALKLIILYKATGKNSDYINQFQDSDPKSMIEVMDHLVSNMSGDTLQNYAMNTITQSDLDVLTEDGFLKLKVYKEEFTEPNETYQVGIGDELSNETKDIVQKVYSVSGENEISDIKTVEVPLNTEIPVSFLPDSIGSKIYNRLGSKGSIGSEREIAVPDTNTIGGSNEENYILSKANQMDLN